MDRHFVATNCFVRVSNRAKGDRELDTARLDQNRSALLTGERAHSIDESQESAMPLTMQKTKLCFVLLSALVLHHARG